MQTATIIASKCEKYNRVYATVSVSEEPTDYNLFRKGGDITVLAKIDP